MSRRIEGEIIIKRTVQEVFDFCADESNEPRYNPRMTHAEQISSEAIGLGSQFQAEMRTMGRKVSMTIEWTAYKRPRRLASWTRLSGMDIRGDLRFDPDAVGVGPRAARRAQADGTDGHPNGPTPGADHMGRPETCAGNTGDCGHSCVSVASCGTTGRDRQGGHACWQLPRP